jgi:hypothetical protein
MAPLPNSFLLQFDFWGKNGFSDFFSQKTYSVLKEGQTGWQM